MTARRRRLFRWAFVIALCFCFTPTFRANEHSGCGSINNSGNNRITVFEILGNTGELKAVQEIATGGNGAHGGYYSIPQIAATSPRNGKACVFAVNAATHNVSAFRVTIELEPGNTCNCQHDLVGAGPVSIGADARFGALGGGVAVAPDGGALYTANPDTSNLSTFLVGGAAPTALTGGAVPVDSAAPVNPCGLRLVGPRVPSPARPSDIQVKPDGRCLAVASPDDDTVGMFSIGSDRLLKPAGVFAVPGAGRASGVEFTRSVTMDTLYVTKAEVDRTVIARFHVRPDCGLETNPQVTSVATGRVSHVAQLDPENQCLYVPNQGSASIKLLTANHPPSTLTTFAVNPETGDLSLVATVDDVAFFPAGMGFAETYDGQRFLYYTSFDREVLRRPVRGCTAAAVSGAPVRTGVAGTGTLRTLVIYH